MMSLLSKTPWTISSATYSGSKFKFKNLKFTISAPLNNFVLINDGQTNEILILFLGFKTPRSTLKPNEYRLFF